MARLASWRRNVLAGFLGVALGFGLLVFLEGGLGSILNGGPSSSSGAVQIPTQIFEDSAHFPAEPSLREIVANSTNAYGILGILGGLSLGVAIFSTIVASRIAKEIEDKED